MTSKRSSDDAGLVESDRDILEFLPLGGGCEVGRSCHLLRFKGKTIMLDCGLHPAYSGLASMPYFDEIEPSEIDIILVTHFHLDHAAALPYMLEKTDFKGRVFMTHPTKSIYKLILQDYVKVSTISVEETLYDEQDLLNSMNKIECVNYHQVMNVNGIKFWAYNAGHVLGAAMFMIEIANVRVLYTGDYSRREDRHLMGAETPKPSLRPHVLIIEATYGTQELRPVEEREARFCELVSEIVTQRQGSVLIPVFALGRAQELLLILDEYWQAHPALQSIPVYFASFLAKKCMDVYKTYLLMMNKHIQEQSQVRNPFAFKHIYNLKNLNTFDETQPCVILASPGMLQNGVSRELLELWCTDERNACIIAGYAVEGTLAKHIMSEPSHITAMNGTKLPLKMSVHYISFSAHADYAETSEFISILAPQHCILVHGDINEGVGKLKAALVEKYHDTMNIVGPKNLQSVELEFKAVKMVKTVGRLAKQQAIAGEMLDEMEEEPLIDGVIVRKDFTYTLMSAQDLPNFTPIAVNTIEQQLLVPFHQTYECMKTLINQLFDCEEPTSQPAIQSDDQSADKSTDQSAEQSTEQSADQSNEQSTNQSSDLPSEPSQAFNNSVDDEKPHPETGKTLVVSGSLKCSWHVGHLSIDWLSSPVDDMIADSLVSLFMNAQANPGGAKMIGVAHNHDHEHDHDHEHSHEKNDQQSSDSDSDLPIILTSSSQEVTFSIPKSKQSVNQSADESINQSLFGLLEAQYGPSTVVEVVGQKCRSFNVDGVIVAVEMSSPHSTSLAGAASAGDASFASIIVDRVRRSVARAVAVLSKIKQDVEEEPEDDIVNALNVDLDSDELMPV